jgi:serine/threonine protein phosphatase PrpC
MGGETVGNAFAPIAKDVLRAYSECRHHKHALACVQHAGHQSRWNASDGTESWLRSAKLSYERTTRPFQGADIMDELRYLFEAISDAIADVQVATREVGVAGLLTVCRVAGDAWFVANVGDCRAYFSSQDGIVQISEDHVLPERSAWTQVVMRSDRLQPKPFVTRHITVPGDILLMATADVFGGRTATELLAFANELEASGARHLPVTILPEHRPGPVLLRLIA